MKEIVFYEKTGCKGNARQKVMLEENGFIVRVKSLLDESWSPESLQPFLEGRDVPEWFNASAPDIKSGSIDPDKLDSDAALELLIEKPILIRRPLIEYDGVKVTGFDNYVMSTILGIDTDTIVLEGCVKSKSSETCP